MTASYIALGGNAGDVFQTMEHGLSLLERVAGVRVLDVSPVYKTAPVGPSHGTCFLNAACRLECELEPLVLLRETQSIENQLGREHEMRWGPRPLDLDLLLFGDVIASGLDLMLPHPHLWYRRFVLDPLCDLAADTAHPVLGKSIRALRASLLQRPLPVALVGGIPEATRSLDEQLQARFSEFAIVDVSASDVPLSPDLIAFDLAPGSDTPDVCSGEPRPETAVESTGNRTIRLRALPGSTFDAAVSALTAALDEPARQSRPLRRMP